MNIEIIIDLGLSRKYLEICDQLRFEGTWYFEKIPTKEAHTLHSSWLWKITEVGYVKELYRQIMTFHEYGDKLRIINSGIILAFDNVKGYPPPRVVSIFSIYPDVFGLSGSVIPLSLAWS